jgi:hypothetical protein
MEKLENKLIDMRDLYEEKKEKNLLLLVRVLYKIAISNTSIIISCGNLTS